MIDAFYDAETAHTRLQPFRRTFRHRMFQLLLDIDRIAATASRLTLFSYNAPNVFSFHDRDHGARRNEPLRPWAEAQFRSAGIDVAGGPIRLLSFPRVLGYVFNPISVFFGYGPAGDLRGVLYEVNNTFGDSHTYAAKIEAPRSRHAAPKRLHVSPFFAVEGRYRFAIAAPGDRIALSVLNETAVGVVHAATLSGRRRPLNDATLALALARMPFMTLGVIAGIHWHALRLWLRGARYRRRPPPLHPAFTPAAPFPPSTPEVC